MVRVTSRILQISSVVSSCTSRRTNAILCAVGKISRTVLDELPHLVAVKLDRLRRVRQRPIRLETALKDVFDVIGLLLALEPSHRLGDFPVENTEQPGAHMRPAFELRRLLDERGKCSLGDVFGTVWIETRPACRPEDLLQVSLDDGLDYFSIARSDSCRKPWIVDPHFSSRHRAFPVEVSRCKNLPACRTH